MSDGDELAGELDRLAVLYFNGNPLGLLYALTLAGKCGQAPPQWATQALSDALVAYNNGTAATLDAALGLCRPRKWNQPKHIEMFEVKLSGPYVTKLAHLEAIVDQAIRDGLSMTAACKRAAGELAMEPKTVGNWYRRAQEMRAISVAAASVGGTDSRKSLRKQGKSSPK